MKIACLGWGSLIWDPRDLINNGSWYENGPFLPIEYLRQSTDGRITLVIESNSRFVQTLWTLMNTDDLQIAILSLANREGISEKFVSKSIGYILKHKQPNNPIEESIKKWALKENIDAVIWTGLKPRFNQQQRSPSIKEIITYIKAVDNTKLKLIEMYIRRTPIQIKTKYRAVFETEFDWYPISI